MAGAAAGIFLMLIVGCGRADRAERATGALGGAEVPDLIGSFRAASRATGDGVRLIVTPGADDALSFVMHFDGRDAMDVRGALLVDTEQRLVKLQADAAGPESDPPETYAYRVTPRGLELFDRASPADDGAPTIALVRE
jgi:hypothetical protein